MSVIEAAIRIFGAPKRLYLDNGSTYRGDALQTACGRLDISLEHASPNDPQACGKMERFWRTMRRGCMDHMGLVSSVHDVQVRLLAWLGQRYHKAAHAGLIGRAPVQAWAGRELVSRSEDALVDALTLRETRRIRTDCTLSIGNVTWEVADAFLAGRNVTVARTLDDVVHRGSSTTTASTASLRSILSILSILSPMDWPSVAASRSQASTPSTSIRSRCCSTTPWVVRRVVGVADERPRMATSLRSLAAAVLEGPAR